MSLTDPVGECPACHTPFDHDAYIKGFCASCGRWISHKLPKGRP